MGIKIYVKGRNLELARKKSGLNQKEFAERIGKTRPWYNQAEQGKEAMSEQTARKICQQLEVKFDELFEIKAGLGEGKMALVQESPLGMEEVQKIIDRQRGSDAVSELVAKTLGDPSVPQGFKKMIKRVIISLIEGIYEQKSEKGNGR